MADRMADARFAQLASYDAMDGGTLEALIDEAGRARAAEHALAVDLEAADKRAKFDKRNTIAERDAALAEVERLKAEVAALREAVGRAEMQHAADEHVFAAERRAIQAEAIAPPTLAERDAAAAEKVAEAARKMAEAEGARSWGDEVHRAALHRAHLADLEAHTTLCRWLASVERVRLELICAALKGGADGKRAVEIAEQAAANDLSLVAAECALGSVEDKP